ncbi:MAG: GrpB family protein [Candidatus Colwellbacteria bacterium]
MALRPELGLMVGLKRGTVKLVPHNKKWTGIFEKEKKLFQKTFGDTIIAIEHIGSTAIPGIPAKPVIDMNVGVKSLQVARRMKGKLEEIGYEHRPFVPDHTKSDLKWQELYVKGPEARRTHYVHVSVYGGNYWKNDLLFRDYLRKHPIVAKQYANLKRGLAKDFADDRGSYTATKEKFIRDLLKKAEIKK